jgi:hypothetical protein
MITSSSNDEDGTIHDDDAIVGGKGTTITTTTTATTMTTVSNSNSSSNTTTLVYIPSKEYAWLPARILSTTLLDPSNSKSSNKSSTGSSNTGSNSSTSKSIAVAVAIPKSSKEEQLLGIQQPSLSSLSSSSSSLQEETQTIVLSDREELPLQNVVYHGNSTTANIPTLQIVTDLADLPFLHEVRNIT